MRLLFLNESGRIDQGGLFALGGVVVRDSDWPQLRDLWQKTLRDAGWPLDREVKWHGIRKGEVPPSLADAVFNALAIAPFTCYVTIFDLDAGPAAFPPREYPFFRTPEDTYATALMFVAERFQHLLVGEADFGSIVIDSCFRESDARLRRFFADLTDAGTPYMKLNRIVEGLFLGPSHYSIGLQCADLVVAATAAAEYRSGNDHKPNYANFDRYLDRPDLFGCDLDEVRETGYYELTRNWRIGIELAKRLGADRFLLVNLGPPQVAASARAFAATLKTNERRHFVHRTWAQLLTAAAPLPPWLTEFADKRALSKH